MGRESMHVKRSLAVAVALVASLAIGGVVLAAAGTLDIGAPWGPANQTADKHVEVTYTIKASGNIPDATVEAVEDGVTAWIEAINTREGGAWVFDIVPFSDSTLPSGVSRGSPVFACHRGQGSPDKGGCGNGDDGGKPDIEIQLKKGGGLIAGSAQSTIENGFRVHVKIQISGSAFGLANLTDTITEVTKHELGHAFGLGHHSNEDDLMGRTVGSIGGISACDLDGFEESQHWLTTDPTATVPHTNHVLSIAC